MSPPADPLAAQLAGRPAWQVLALAAGIVLGTVAAVVVVSVAATATAPASPLSGRFQLAAVGLPVVLGLYEAARRLVLRAPPAWFLAGRPDRAVLGWAVVGLAFPAAVLGGQLWLFDATMTNELPGPSRLIPALVASLAAGLLAGVLEELALRGALLRVLEARWGSTVAVGATAVVFAALHQGHASRITGLVLVLSSMLGAGCFLGVVVVRTRSVWNAVALHAGWNTVFGGSLVTVAAPRQPLEAALVQFRLGASPTLLPGEPASLGVAPLTAVCLVLATAVVVRAPGRWLGVERRTGEP